MKLANVGQEIRQERQQLGWSLVKLSEEAGVAEQTVVNIEQGHSKPNWSTLEKLVGAMERARELDGSK